MAIDWETVKKKAKEKDKKRVTTGVNTTAFDDIAPIRTTTTLTGDDIAPVRPVTTVSSKKEKERTWFQKSEYFADGKWDKGDLTKTILGSLTDVGENLGTGIIGMGEKAVDALAMVGNAMSGQALNQAAQDEMIYNVVTGKNADNVLGNYQAAQREVTKGTVEFVKKDLYNEEAVAKKIISAPVKEFTGVDSETDSVFGEKSDALVQSGGQLLGTAGLQAIGIPWYLTTGATAFGSQSEEALKEGATYEEAMLSSAVSAGAEILTEKLSGGIKFGGKTLDDVLTKPLLEKISNKAVKILVNIGLDATGEGAEEVVSGVMSNLGTALYKEEDLGEILASEEALDEYLESFIGGAVLGGGSSAVTQVANRKAVELTENEQKVFDKEVENRIAEVEKDGKKVTKKEESAIRQAVLNDLLKGYISIDTIESTLGGETYDSYKLVTEQEENLQNEFKTLNQMKQGEMTGEQIDRRAELKQQLEEVKNNSNRTQIKEQLSNEVLELAKDSRLAESYNEKSRRGQSFEADLSKYDTKQQEVIKKAVESGILNNTNRTHEFVDMIAKISADKGVLFDFVNNEKLKTSGFAVEGKTVNGYKTDDGNIALNIDSSKALNSVVGHEITHILEGTELYSALQEVVKQYATTKGEYSERMQSLRKLYTGVYKGTDFDAKLQAELTADIVGDYLFSDSDFINSLSTEQPNLFKKIYNEIKYLYKVATAGSKEARELEKVKRAFEQAYKDSGTAQKNTTDKGDVKYSISETTDGRIVAVVDSNILENIDTTSWDNTKKETAKKAATKALKQFSDGIVVDGITRKVNRRSRKEYTRSEYTEGLYNKTPDVFADKMRAADIADDIVVATTNWNRDGGLKHPRDDNFVDFDHGTTLIATGTAKYSAEVVVGITDKGEAVFYDVVDMVPTNFDIKNAESPTTATTQNAIGDIHGNSAKNSLPQNSEKSSENTQYSLSYNDNQYIDAVNQGDNATAQMLVKESAEKAGYTDVLYHGTKQFGFTEFDASKSDDKISFFVAGSDDIAQTYSGKYGSKAISSAESVDDLSIEDVVNKLREEAKDDYEDMQNEYEIMHREDVNALIEEVNSGVEKLQSVVEQKIKDYAEKLATDFDDKDVKTHKQLVELNEILDDYQYEYMSTPIYMLLHHTDAFSDGGVNQAEIAELETNIRLMNKLINTDTSGGVVVNKQLGGYGLSILTFDDARTELKNKLSSGNYALFGKPGKQFVVDCKGSNWNDITYYEDIPEELKSFYPYGLWRRGTTRDVVQYAKSLGYDSVKFENVVDNGGRGENVGAGDVYAYFNPNNLKSADTVTYDDNGNIIPLSERFNEDNDDIRYSLSKQGEHPIKNGNYHITGEDIRYKEDIAPTISKMEKVAPVGVAKNATTTFDDIAPTGSKTEKVAPLDDDLPIRKDLAPTKTEEDIAPPVKSSKKKDDKGQQIAKILTKEPETKKKSKLWSKIKTNFIDKASPFETLALKTGNREVDAKYNSIRYSDTKAQLLIGEGADGVKALNDIQAEVENSGLTEALYDYLYHKHNVDRMSLESREAPNLERLTEEIEKLELDKLNENQLYAISKEFITKKTDKKRANLIKTVREYLKTKGVKNKPVFGNSMTAELSQKIVDKYEFENPKLIEYANDVYTYNKYLRNLLVEGGVISQETADLWEEMYPHFVPIRRVDSSGLNVNVPLASRRTGVNAPIKKATGGNTDILPLFETMAQRTLQTYKAVAKNRFGIELKNTLGTTVAKSETSVDEVIDSIDTQDDLLKEGKYGKNPTFTVFENGEKVTFEITDEMYDAMKPTSEGLAYTNKVANTISNSMRGVLTEYNPTFMLTNAIKDAQDVLINSQHPVKTYKNFPKAVKELASKGEWYTEYIKNGGADNTYFDKQTNTFNKEKSGLSKAIGFPLEKISMANNFIERIPRLAEYIASRESGRSVDVSMLDSARVTTNFSAGGDVTKFLNRNGATFLNASVQGAAQQVRNVREAKANGLKGWVQLATKFALAGLPALFLNGLLWDDDEEYEELSDYVKQNYYVVAKMQDGKFVRIPKGRTMAVIQEAFTQVQNALTGDDEVDLQSFLDLAISNLAPNNPLDNNIIAPIMQVKNNETWYGEDLVPTRLQDVPDAEQYDESTDAISKWLGEKLNYSPYKINYLLNQYSGGLGDMFLPMLTPEAESGDNSLLGNFTAPMKDKFSTDSVFNNQNTTDFYNVSDELMINANSINATDEDVLKNKYFNSISTEIGELYKEKREIQNSDLSDDLKFKQVRDIQKQINEITENALNTYENVTINGSYANIGDKHYRLNDDGEWQKITDEQLEKQNEVIDILGITPSQYWGNKAEYDMKALYPEKYKVLKEQGISVDEYKEKYEEKSFIYTDDFSWASDNPEKYTLSKAITDDVMEYKQYTTDLYNIKADKDSNGKSISGSKKNKKIEYINNLNIDYGAKCILLKSEYPSDDTYNKDIVDYLNGRDDITFEEKKTILEELGATIDDKGYIRW